MNSTPKNTMRTGLYRKSSHALSPSRCRPSCHTSRNLASVTMFHNLLFVCLLASVVAQGKQGVCPPSLPVAVCYSSCAADTQCQGFYKCCPTACGGSICSRPVTPPRSAPLKTGTCPVVPRGPWVCTDMCSSDSDCRGRTKCCRNRCGALTCQLPDLLY